jgi:hypothetical protein
MGGGGLAGVGHHEMRVRRRHINTCVTHSPGEKSYQGWGFLTRRGRGGGHSLMRGGGMGQGAFPNKRGRSRAGGIL